MMHKLWSWSGWWVVVISAVVGYWCTAQINLVTADLGRHLINGRIFWESGQIPGINLYSYTFPNFQFINHHWLTGVIFWVVYQSGGFSGLSWLQWLVNGLTFGLLFNLVWQRTDRWLALAVAIGFLPLMISRTEIRPEMFSYLLIAVFVVLLYQYYHDRLAGKWLWCLVPLELLWVNLHIYFIMGIGLVGLFIGALILAGLTKQSTWRLVWPKLRWLGVLVMVLALSSLLNPQGVIGATQPFLIFGNYGYRILEEQTVWFLQAVYPVPILSYFYLGVLILGLSWIWVGWQVRRGRQAWPWPEVLLSVVFVGMGAWMMRNFSLFGLIGMTVVGLNFSDLSLKDRSSEQRWGYRVGLVGGMLMLILMLNANYWLGRPVLGIGLAEGNDRAAEFFKTEKLIGPIFNNYDIGGYLTFYFYPQERVFVDNRPEAYPASFFQQTYVPMQENQEQWLEQDAKYHFNVIFFHRLDLTPWAQTFLINRVKDPEWAPVFVDERTIILVRRNAQNQTVIKQYELPKSMFGMG